MTASVLDPAILICPTWCSQEHGVETDGTDVWVTHGCTVEVEVGSTSRCIVVWVNATNTDQPSFALGSDRLDCRGGVARYDDLPGPCLDADEAAALQAALSGAMALVHGEPS
ncbi:hypothetical protein [Cryptosporangium phraense]|uniref:Uncharacterized protein n=1 Tax=Cryptosporangium phraense TaxID=2593070 RepID=A0A545ASN3_9ACTN|nr:hypothetical protein [Cryptosporangium phraense]TQS44328.1 hypothetical protein FL583_15460 [Cryptosporangium phraense]